MAHTTVGERIAFDGANNGGPADPAISPKKLHKLLKDLSTTDAGCVQFKQLLFQTSAGPVTSSLKGAPVK